ncbi:MAG: response-associated peptidase [Subtercola sp.]|nr:response-associated peptidase [Subtercola sp.]
MRVNRRVKARRVIELWSCHGGTLNEMRSRFALTETPDRLAAVFGATASSTTGWKPSYKFAPARKIIIVRAQTQPQPQPQTRADAQAGARELITASWGFTPTWLSGQVPPIIRVGMERILSNGYFHDAFLNRRCLVPMLGYYDWQSTPDGGSQSYFVRGPGQVLAAMGVYNVRESGSRSQLSVALVTRDTGSTVDDRVPSVLDEPLWGEWLGGGTSALDDHGAEDLLARVATRSHDLAETLTRTRVGDTINSPYARDAVSLISPLRKRA